MCNEEIQNSLNRKTWRRWFGDEYVTMETEGSHEKNRENFSSSGVFASGLCNEASGYTINGQSVRYKCPLCDVVFPMPGAMKHHFRTHGNELKGPFNCTEQGCQFSTPDRQIYQDHLTTKHAFTLIPCTFRSCSLAFCSRVEMDQHWRNHMPFHCPLCQFVTTHAKNLSAHCLEHGQQGKKVQPTTTGLDGGSRSGPETGSGRPRRACKRNPVYESQDEGDEEEAERRQKKRATKEMQKDKSAVASNKKFPSKGHIMEGTEHMYHTHICPECHRCFKMRSHLQEHLHLHFPDPGLQCPTCKHFFTSKSKLRVHMLRESGQKVHRCHLCEYAAVEGNSLRRHLVSVHDEGGVDGGAEVYPCPTCGETFRQSRALKAHMKSHRAPQDGEPLACFRDGCPFQSSDRKELLKHAADAHAVEAVECSHHACNAVFGSREDMETHRRTHLAFHCSQCDYSCSNKTLFHRHRRRGHAGDEELSCDFCPFATFNPVEFHQHVGHFHASEKIHRCLQCDFVTAHKRVLRRHTLMHSGEKPHKCNLCDFRCRDETYLSKHMLTHSADKNHMCSECGYVTKWKHYLNVHMRKHAGDLRYQCDQCSYRCHRTDQLNSHKLRHQAKSLMCEVCAYSCKRKYELRRHMLLKHSQGEGHKPPTFQCKYCPYHTCYRQALLNHENCKHTRTREFRCALCPYSTYSGTSLFLHKRKIHGYVPGDKEWLEKYAAKERENDAIDFLQDFFRAPVATRDPSKKCADLTREHVTDSIVQSRCNQETLPGLETSEMENDSVVVPQEMINQGISVDDPEQCCTLVLTAVSNAECVETTFMEGVTDTGRDLTHQRPVIDSKGPDSPKPWAPSGNEEEEENVMADCEDGPSDLDNDGTPLALTCHQEEAAGEDATETHTTETMEACEVSSAPSEPSVHNESTETEVRLKAMRRHDRDQAEALVLEGRVQMLVVRKQDDETIYRCDHCSYVSRKQTSLKHHCRSACRARRLGLKCQACGAQFKQKRGLDTHCLRKCPALQKTRRVVCRPSANLPVGEESGYDENGFKQSDKITTYDHTELPACDNETARELVGTLSEERVEEGNVSDLTNPSAEEVSNSGPQEIQRRKESEKTKGCLEVVTVKKGKVSQNKDGASSSTESEMKNMHGCTTVNGKFTCELCSFTSRRLATVERHCTRCRGKQAKKPAGSFQDLEVGDGNERPQGGEKVEGDRDSGEAVEKVSKSSHRFSCPSCPFMCHQKRALDTHEKRGCLKPDEVQCQLCSFVAKSQKALTNHVLVHQRDKPLSSKLYKKVILHCEQCPFTCKQERCMTQHVALKHEGARPHRCSFCPFSTTRRYRLEAHKSLHTGVGRHSCHVCSQTFGTSSKLQQHGRRVHDKRPSHFCSLCDFSGYTLNDIGRHTLSCHTGELTHACGQCQSRFSSEAALKQHCNRQHSSFSCPQCSFTCRSQATLKTHRQSKHLQLECTLCQEAFDTQESLETHRRTHLTQRCPLCTFATRRKQLLAQHLLDEHERGRPEDKPLKCAICGFTCSHQLVLEQHARSHGATRIYKCTDCQYSTRNKQKITWHSRIHTGEKPYHCEECSYACADPSRLKYHMRIHQEEKKYLCPECGYKCKWMSQLKYHMTKHTGDKPYACDECEYRTNRGDSLRIHRDTQHRDTRSYICEKCGKGFKTRFLLKTHQRKHSEEKPYVCGQCQKSFRWPAGLRHHYLTHSNQQAFLCRHCPYRAKHRFQVVKHLQRHHPKLPVEEGVAKDPSFLGLSLQEARLGAMEEVPRREEERQDGVRGEAEIEAQ